jgi:hypothetical protein
MEFPYLKDTRPRRNKKSGFEKQYWNNLKPHSEENKNSNESHK